MLEEKTFHYKGKGLKPKIQLTIKHGEREASSDAVIDSGADISIFDASIAEHIGLPFSRFEQKQIAGVSGFVKANICKVQADILGEFFELPVAFVSNYSGPFNILGRKGFFEKHVITFDEAKLEIKVKKST